MQDCSGYRRRTTLAPKPFRLLSVSESFPGGSTADTGLNQSTDMDLGEEAEGSRCQLKDRFRRGQLHGGEAMA